jgi:hypothetical protein
MEVLIVVRLYTPIQTQFLIFVKLCTYVVSTIGECNVSMESNLIFELGPRIQVNV